MTLKQGSWGGTWVGQTANSNATKGLFEKLTPSFVNFKFLKSVPIVNIKLCMIYGGQFENLKIPTFS